MKWMRVLGVAAFMAAGAPLVAPHVGADMSAHAQRWSFTTSPSLEPWTYTGGDQQTANTEVKVPPGTVITVTNTSTPPPTSSPSYSTYAGIDWDGVNFVTAEVADNDTPGAPVDSDVARFTVTGTGGQRARIRWRHAYVHDTNPNLFAFPGGFQDIYFVIASGPTVTLAALESDEVSTITASGTCTDGSTVTVTFPSGDEKEATCAGGNYEIVSEAGEPDGQVVAVAENNLGTSSEATRNYVAPPVYVNLYAPTDDVDGYVTARGVCRHGSNVTVTFPDMSTATTACGANRRYEVTSPNPNQPSGDVTATARNTGTGETAGPVTRPYTDGTPPTLTLQNEDRVYESYNGAGHWRRVNLNNHVTTRGAHRRTFTVVDSDGTRVNDRVYDLPLGKHTFSVTASDSEHTVGPEEFTVYVVDNSIPVLDGISRANNLVENDDRSLTVTGTYRFREDRGRGIDPAKGTEYPVKVDVTFPDGTVVEDVPVDPMTGTWTATAPGPQPVGRVYAEPTDSAAAHAAAIGAPGGATDNVGPRRAVNWILRATVDRSWPDPDGRMNVTGKCSPGAALTVTFPSGATLPSEETPEPLICPPSGEYTVKSDKPEETGPATVAATGTFSGPGDEGIPTSAVEEPALEPGEDNPGTTDTEAGKDTPATETTDESDPTGTTSGSDGSLAYSGSGGTPGETLTLNCPDGSTVPMVVATNGTYSGTCAGPQPAGPLYVTNSEGEVVAGDPDDLAAVPSDTHIAARMADGIAETFDAMNARSARYRRYLTQRQIHTRFECRERTECNSTPNAGFASARNGGGFYVGTDGVNYNVDARVGNEAPGLAQLGLGQGSANVSNLLYDTGTSMYVAGSYEHGDDGTSLYGTIGADTFVTDDTLIGAMASYETHDFTYDTDNGIMDIEKTGPVFEIYGAQRIDEAYSVEGGLSYGMFSNEAELDVVGGVVENVEFDSDRIDGFLQGSFRTRSDEGTGSGYRASLGMRVGQESIDGYAITSGASVAEDEVREIDVYIDQTFELPSLSLSDTHTLRPFIGANVRYENHSRESTDTSTNEADGDARLGFRGNTVLDQTTIGYTAEVFGNDLANERSYGIRGEVRGTLPFGRNKLGYALTADTGLAADEPDFGVKLNFSLNF